MARKDWEKIDDEIDLAGEHNPFGVPERDLDDEDLEPGIDPRAFDKKPLRIPLALTFVAGVAGAWFAGVSTADFVSHLDRDVHAITCSFTPGADKEFGESGCRTVMLSPYSSWFREDIWGGIPVSLWALAVFAFLAYRAGHLLVRGRAERRETFFLFAATCLPVLMSAIYGYLAVYEVGATCTVCVGMYVASGGAFVGALAAFLMTAPAPSSAAIGGNEGLKTFSIGFAEGVAFVGVLTLAYMASVPEAGAAGGVDGCGTLVQKDDPAGIMIPLSAKGEAPAIELLDPLCPACRAFDARLKASGLDAKLDLDAVLFPLDASCNWMLTESLHPGACAVSEAMLCAAGRAGQPGDPAEARRILKWAFANQEDLLEMAKIDDASLRAKLEQQFPAVKGCLGGTVAKNKVVKSLRWAVANALPVLTPQLFVRGARMCDEDTDLGLDYTLSKMVARGGR